MIVFTEEWAKQVRQRYERQPVFQRPHIYDVVTGQDWKQLRDEIETFVAALPEEAQEQVIPRLQSSENFTETYHELIVGDAFKSLGFNVEYSPQIDGLTPDWRVFGKEGIPNFITEVFTVNRPNARDKEQHYMGLLLEALKKIPISAELFIEFTNSTKFPEPHHIQRIANRVQRWLIADVPLIGAVLSLDKVKITYIGGFWGLPYVRCVGQGAKLPIDTAALERNLKGKIRRYKDIVEKLNLPLVVAAIADPYTLLDLENFKDVLFGKTALRRYQLPTGQIISQQWVRRLDGVIETASGSPSLSAALWVSQTGPEDWYIHAVLNEKAKHPLPPTTFEQMISPAANVKR